MTLTPVVYTGGWRRRWLQVGDSEASEPGTVVWLQAGDHYIDIRTCPEPTFLTGPGVFAGHTTFGDSRITWHHEIDCPALPSSAGPVQDVGHISWSGYDEFTERGVTDTGDGSIAYTELWERIRDAQHEPAYSMTPADGEGLAVRCGSHLVGVHRPDPATPDRWGAVHLRLSAQEWDVVLCLGDAAVYDPLTDALLDAVESDRPSLAAGSEVFNPSDAVLAAAFPTQPPTMKWTIHDITTALST